MGYYYWYYDTFVYSQFTIVPSKADFGRTGGILGNWNNLDDDLLYLRNTNTSATESAIFNSYR